MNTSSLIATFVQEVVTQFETDWSSITIQELEAADGRTKNANPACTAGSFIYVSYENDHVLYVGETSKSVKRRFIVDGSGSHKEKNFTWYDRTSTIKFIKKTHNELPDKERKLLEQAFSIHFKPEFYG